MFTYLKSKQSTIFFVFSLLTLGSNFIAYFTNVRIALYNWASERRYTLGLNFISFIILLPRWQFQWKHDLNGRARPATLLKKRLWHRCFAVNFTIFLRTSLLQNTSLRLLLECARNTFQTVWLVSTWWEHWRLES